MPGARDTESPWWCGWWCGSGRCWGQLRGRGGEGGHSGLHCTLQRGWTSPGHCPYSDPVPHSGPLWPTAEGRLVEGEEANFPVFPCKTR